MVTLLTSNNDRQDSDVIFRSRDLYLFVCNIYVFSVVVEFAIVGILEDRRLQKNGRKIERLTKISKMENVSEAF